METKLTVIDEKFYDSIKPTFVQLTNEKVFKREIGFAIQALRKNTYLQSCSIESVLEAVSNISQTNLTLNPVLKYAYLIPRKGKCVLEPGYQGLIKLATDSDSIISINVQLVYEGDDCEIDLASDKKILKHVPYLLTGKEKGKILFGYSSALLKGGSIHVEIMSIKQILDVREYSESYKHYKSKKEKGEWASTVWESDAPEMCRKTIVKRHFKYLPKSENKYLEKAIELDNEDYDFPLSYEQGNYIESLLMSSAIPNERENEIYRALHNGDMKSKEAGECIEYLLEHQQDPIDAGKHYQQGDIQNKLSSFKEK